MITESINRMAETEAPSNPFPGLRPFEFDESHLYFGRDGQNEQLLRKLSGTHFVAVVGTSGSGKSSLVRAGLLPALYGGLMMSAGSNWRVALMRPGNDPLGNLARALNAPDVFGSEIEENAELQTTITEVTLRRGSLGLVEAVRQNRMSKNENLLVIADQFEEIFRYAQVAADVRYQNDAAAFVKLLLEAARQRESSIYVVLTLRSDYLGDCSLFWDLPEAINEGQYLIPRLTREQRRQAITGPVAVGGAEITPRLVNLLLNEMGDNPDQLPILQHALMRTWDRWKQEGKYNEPLDIRHYEAIGGMREALSRHADEAYFELPDERSREIAERLFKALTEKGKDNRETRRPIEIRELCAATEATEAEIISVIEPFRQEGRSFLMPPSTVPLSASSLIDISHESLIRNWRRLSEWVEEESRSARIYRRLAETAALYEKGEAGLWHDPDLQLALDWRERSRPNKAWATRYHTGFESAMSFLDASRAAREREAEEKEAQRKKELRRVRMIAAILLVAFIISLASTVYAFSQQREASRQRATAEQKAREALRQSNIALQQTEEAEKQKGIALNQSQEALRQKGIAEEQSTKAKEAEQVALNQKQEAEKANLVAQQQARIARESELKAKEANSVAERRRLEAVREKERAEVGEKQNLRLLYAATLNLAQQAYEDKETLRAQELLYTLWPQKDELGFEWYYLWRRYHGYAVTFTGHTDKVNSVALSPDGKTLATGSSDNTVKLWDVASKQELATLKGFTASVWRVAFSPDGKTLATGSLDKNVKLWDVGSKRELATLRGSTGHVTDVTFSPDGRTLAVAGFDSVKLWDVASRKELATLKGLAYVSAFSPDGRILVVGGGSHVAKLWDVVSKRELATLTGHMDSVGCVAFSPDGKTLATGSSDKTVKLWDVGSKQEVAMLTSSEGVTDVAFSPDGRTIAVAGQNNVILWDVASRRELIRLGGHTDFVRAVAFSADGKTLATASDDRTAKLWQITSQDELAKLRGHKDAVLSVAFSPDSRMFATGGADNTVRLWDATSQRELATLAEEENALSVAFSPDGKTFATGGEQGTVKLWNTTTHQKLATLNNELLGAVLSLAFSPDGKTLVAAGFNIAKLWDVASRRELATFTLQSGQLTGVAFSPDGKTLAIAGWDWTVRLWDVASRRELLKLEGHKDVINSVAFSPDGRTLATGSNDKTVKLWDAATGRELKTLTGHSGNITCLAFSPDGRTLATGSEDKLVKLWSTATYQELLTLKGHLGAISSLAFSPDGKLLATGSYDQYVRLWYAATEEDVVAQRRREEK
jgi:WD40 repeat protein